MLTYGSVCSGIEAATVAWHPLGWRPAFFAEVDKFASSVLAHHYGSNLPGETVGANGVPNLGDITKFEGWPDYAIDILVGGTPCQSFSVAGLRKGLDDERGNLMLVYAAIARRYRPRWICWENVPGVLSDDGGRGFASLLGLLSGRRVETPPSGWKSAGIVPGIEGAYGLAWRVLDAQYVRVDGFGRAVPQRRRRVFVVGYSGDWRRAAAVLFERAGLCGNSPPRRETGQGSAPTLAARTKGGGGLGTDFDCDGGLVANQEADVNLIALNSLGGVSHALTAKHSATGRYDPNGETWVAHALRGGGFDASEDGTGRGTPLVPVEVAPTLRAGANATGGDRPYGTDVDTCDSLVPIGVALRGRDGGATAELTGNVMTSLRTGGGGGDKPHVLLPVGVMPLLEIGKGSTSRVDGPNGAGSVGDPMDTLQAGAQHGVAICFDETQITSASNRSAPQDGDPSHPIAAGARPPTIAFHARQDPDTGPVGVQGMRDGTSVGVFTNWRVRRPTPRECERLQGFPDDYTNIPYRNKVAADGPRYRSLGNSMACNVMRWIGWRMEVVEKMMREQA